MLFENKALIALEYALNESLRLDKKSQKSLAALSPKVIRLKLEDVNLDCLLSFQDNGILFSAYKQTQNNHYDVFVTTKAKNILSCRSIDKCNSKVEGDQALYDRITAIIKESDIDHMALLSQIFGEGLFVPASEIMRSGIKRASDAFASGKKSCQEYKHFELEGGHRKAFKSQIQRANKRAIKRLKRASEHSLASISHFFGK